MKERERQIIKLANSMDIFDSNLEEYSRVMSPFDAYNESCIVEIKHRNEYWQEPVIEFSKYTFNKEFAKMNKLNFLYLNKLGKYLVLFDILYLESIDYDFKWHWKEMPATTEFNKKKMVEKYVGYINVKDACEQIEIV